MLVLLVLAFEARAWDLPGAADAAAADAIPPPLPRCVRPNTANTGGKASTHDTDEVGDVGEVGDTGETGREDGGVGVSLPAAVQRLPPEGVRRGPLGRVGRSL
jgi:hypothetical protein